MYKCIIGVFFWLLFSLINCGAQPFFDTAIRPADAVPAKYIPLLKGKKVAIIVNQTSKVGDSTLLDMLLVRDVKVVKIFVPEHGFRGNEDAGANVESSIDSQTQLPVISLYGKHKKPTAEDLENVDAVVYDLQDVGVRFYTYISTLQYCLEACAQQQKQFIVLDKPDPNGFYIDGPVLDTAFKSFVGMQAIPVVYAMTPGEYAMMLKGENRNDSVKNIDLQVIKCINYDHSKKYKLPVAPSPNLRTMAAVYAYPSLCLFEGTIVSVGRGTDLPFQQYGCPELKGVYAYSFTPLPGYGAKKPPYADMKCYGEKVGDSPEEVLSETGNKFQMSWLLNIYKAYPAKDKFFNNFFPKLAGTDELEKQIKERKKEKEIRKTWAEKIKKFKAIRKKYLLYKDFE